MKVHLVNKFGVLCGRPQDRVSTTTNLNMCDCRKCRNIFSHQMPSQREANRNRDLMEAKSDD